MKFNELKAVLRCRQKKEDGFRVVRSRKRYTTDEVACTLKKAALPITSVAQKNEVARRYFFASATDYCNVQRCPSIRVRVFRGRRTRKSRTAATNRIDIRSESDPPAEADPMRGQAELRVP
jgi:hypothetical protein